MTEPLTADTVTDEQIREEMERARGVDYDIFRLAQQALENAEHSRCIARRALRDPSLDAAHIRALAHAVLGTDHCRARCAELINARRGVKP